MLLAMATYALRMRVYSCMSDPRLCLLTEWCNGITWGFMWPCALLHTAKIAPIGKLSSMVGIVTSTYWGVGASLGSLSANFLFARIGR